MKMFFRLILVFFSVVMLSSFSLSAQDSIRIPPRPKNHDIRDRIDIGGYLGLQFGTLTFINISPLVSYRITPKFHAGLGLTYMYYSENSIYGHYSSNSYGGSIFARYFIWRDLFAHFEYAPLYSTNFVYYPPYTNPDGKGPWAQDVLIGAGYRQWIGDKASVNLMLLWNLNQTIYSPYSNPIFRIGFGVGL